MSALLLALALLAGGGHGPPGPDPGVPPTRLGSEVLARRPLVVVASTLEVVPFGIGTAVVRVRLEQVLLGPGHDAGDEVVLFAYAGDFQVQGRDLLCLLPFGRGPRWRILERVDGRDKDFAAKLAATERQVALMGVPDREARIAATFDLLLRWLSDADRWTRGYAVGELAWMADQRPGLFTPDRRARLAIAASSPDPVVREGVASVAATLASRNDALPAAPDQESSPP